MIQLTPDGIPFLRGYVHWVGEGEIKFQTLWPLDLKGIKDVASYRDQGVSSDDKIQIVPRRVELSELSAEHLLMIVQFSAASVVGGAGGGCSENEADNNNVPVEASV